MLRQDEFLWLCKTSSKYLILHSGTEGHGISWLVGM